MALGRNLPDQVNPSTEGRSPSKTGSEPVSPEAVRDYQKDRETAVRQMIAEYDALGKDTSHLKKQLGRKPSQATGAGDTVALGGPAVLEPGSSPPSQVYAPGADTVAEPEDGSAPDKRDQDQSPVPVAGVAEPPADDPYAGAVPVTAADPGPEAPAEGEPGLPEQVSPNLDPPEPPETPLPDQVSPDLGDSDDEKSSERSPAKKTASGKAPAKKAGTSGRSSR